MRHIDNRAVLPKACPFINECDNVNSCKWDEYLYLPSKLINPMKVIPDTKIVETLKINPDWLEDAETCVRTTLGKRMCYTAFLCVTEALCYTLGTDIDTDARNAFWAHLASIIVVDKWDGYPRGATPAASLADLWARGYVVERNPLKSCFKIRTVNGVVAKLIHKGKNIG